MSKIDKVLLDRQSEVDKRLAQLQDFRAMIAKRLEGIDAQIAELTSAQADVADSVAEVAVLVEAGTIVSELPVEAKP